MTDVLEITKEYKRAPAAAINSKQWPKTVKARFIEPGLVDYKDLGLGMILVQRPFLDKVRQSFVGKPVIDEQHKDAKPENFKEIADGAVIRVWNDPADGWDWCEFLVWDEKTMEHVQDPQYFVSCAYDPSKIDRNPGKYHNISYDGEFLEGAYTHLAIVKDPRYEGAKIVWNSLGAKQMNLLKLFKKSEEVAEIDATKTFLDVDGEQVSVENAVKMIQAQNKAKGAMCGMKDDDTIEIDGEMYNGKQLRNAIKNAKKAKNGEGEKGEKAGDQEEEEEEEKEEGKKRDAKNDITEKSVEEDTEKRDKIDKKSAKNSLGKEDDKDHIKEFKDTVEMRNNQPGVPTISTMEDRLKAGFQAYGQVRKDKSMEVA